MSHPRVSRGLGKKSKISSQNPREWRVAKVTEGAGLDTKLKMFVGQVWREVAAGGHCSLRLCPSISLEKGVPPSILLADRQRHACNPFISTMLLNQPTLPMHC